MFRLGLSDCMSIFLTSSRRSQQIYSSITSEKAKGLLYIYFLIFFVKKYIYSNRYRLRIVAVFTVAAYLEIWFNPFISVIMNSFDLSRRLSM